MTSPRGLLQLAASGRPIPRWIRLGGLPLARICSALLGPRARLQGAPRPYSGEPFQEGPYSAQLLNEVSDPQHRHSKHTIAMDSGQYFCSDDFKATIQPIQFCSGDFAAEFPQQ